MNENSTLQVTITSFSYKTGIPEDPSGNGGGHVFDCRAIHNPGRYEPYKTITGRDQPVIDFLEEKTEIREFLSAAFSIVDRSVSVYHKRNFQHLLVSFGCTGGQHRSVYSADALASHLKEKFRNSEPSIKIVVKHIEQERKNWINKPY